MDTPGWHISDKSFNRRMQEVAVKTLDDCDLVLYMLDATRAPGEEERAVSYMLSGLSMPVVCCLNKSDILDDKQLENAKAYLEKALPGREIFEVSALEDNGIDELLICLFSHAPEGDMLYPEDARTDQDLEFRISEIIREKAMNSVRDEIPHAIYVEISDLEYREDEGKVWIRAFINLERESQKGIMVGKGGDNIKKIRKAAFKDIKAIFPNLSPELDLRVRVNPKWKTNERTLKGIFRETF
jgi:GTP-binding protein Era